MPTPDQIRIEADRARPQVLRLWWALQPLRSVIGFMNTGAHPDDETSAMLAALGLRDGLALSYACSTRGEGGQNDIGTEAGAVLGALRTAEMERACDVLGMRMYWLGRSADDPITDFGFSKTGTETFGNWGRAATIARFVDILRQERPDIICPTFLDVPGQHGHHRAMTEAAFDAMDAAADPDYPDSTLPVWQVKKLYLPAWSGAGQAYDDDLPPPPATITVEAAGRDPLTGWSYERIGQQSRAYHRTQAMGRWIAAGSERDWPLHLAKSALDGPDTDLMSGLPATLAELGSFAGADALTDRLADVQDEITECFQAFPDCDRVLTHATEALRLLRSVHSDCPPDAEAEVLHRLAAKERQLSTVIRIAAGVQVHVTAADRWIETGGTTRIETEIEPGNADAVAPRIVLPEGWTDEDGLHIKPGAAPHDGYRAFYDPASPPLPAVDITVEAHGLTSTSRIAWQTTPVVLPSPSARTAPDRLVLNLARPAAELTSFVDDVSPGGAAATVAAPEGWSATADGARLTLTPPDTPTPDLYEMPLHLDGAPAQTATRIAHPHVADIAHVTPAVLRVRVLDAKLPDVRVGYAGSGNDRVGHWLAAMGAGVTDLTDADLASDTALAGFDTIVVGIFAFRFRTALAQGTARLHKWARSGGSLVTLYHRPWDNWSADTTPPARLEIGQPSLRWRVTDQAAKVTHLQPDHPLLTGPNAIGPEDWEGWHKERGLYFAKSWDDAYQPLLSMADPDEDPLTGALLAADIGKGRHVHTSLILHHQMEHLVPGAFRLMANLIAKRE